MMEKEKLVAFKLEHTKDWLQWSYIMNLHFTSSTQRKDIFLGNKRFEDQDSENKRAAFLKLERRMKLGLMRSLGSNYASRIVSIERLAEQWEMLQSVVIGDKHSRLERVKQNLFRMK